MNFDMIKTEQINDLNSYAVLRHKESGVCYIVFKSGAGVGMTTMINSNGSPYVFPAESDE